MKPKLRELLTVLWPSSDEFDQWRDARRRIRKWVGVRAERYRLRAERLEERAAPPLLLLAGWAAVTAGVAELFGAGRVVWPIGAGLLAWGLYGFRTLWITLWMGLAALRKTKIEHPEDR